jgi:hypothetical protein
MKKKYISLIIGAIIVFLLIIFIFVFKGVNNAVVKMRYESDISYVNAGIREALMRYYKNNNKYPAKLIELRDFAVGHDVLSNLKVTDKNELFNKFTYNATDTSYEISVSTERNNMLDTDKEFGEKGEFIAFESYVNGILCKRIEFPNGRGKNPVIEKEYQNGKLILETTNYKTYDEK